MFKCRMHLFGVARDITDLQEVELELPEGASMAEVIAALRQKIPSLEGPVIRNGEDRLQDNYRFNVNGHFYVDGMDFKLNQNDRISLLILVLAGG